MSLSRLSSTSRTLSSFIPHTHHHSSPLPPLSTVLSLQSTTLSIRTSSIQKRAASHASEGRANKPPQGPGKRLGAKKSNSELVVPGNIIFRQRGTHWFPGENCGMGRDHTIFAREKGFVVYYKDPDRHPERKYIGVVFERGQGLPMPRGAARRRRLGMVETAREISTAAGQSAEDGGEGIVQGVVEGQGRVLVAGRGMREAPKEIRKQLPQKVELRLKKGYMYRESNWQIGRAAERANVKVRAYDARDRFAAWRRKAEREAAEAQKKALKPKRGGK